jgi:hypothetical protein
LNRDRILKILAVVLVALGVARIVTTYRVFNQYYDEAFTVTCGVKWVAGDMTCDAKHPPLGRALPALALWLDGARPLYLNDIAKEANTTLGTGAGYWRRLMLLRLGALPFFVLACCAVWLWARWIAGPWAGLLAVLLFSSLPSILGHAAIAMSDIALAATAGLALYFLCRWFEAPSLFRSVVLGASAGLAAATNFSAIPFLGATALLLLLARRGFPRVAWRSAALGIAALCISIWAVFHFDVTRVTRSADGRYPGIDQTLGRSGRLHTLAYATAQVPIPGLPFVTGLILLSQHNNDGQMWNSFAGQRRSLGWWYFYPVALFAKTPLGFLVLMGIGLVFALRSPPGQWILWAAPIAIVGLLATGILSHVNTSIRHILPVYVPATVLAGYGAWRAWGQGGWLRWVAGAALVWHLISSAAAHPDYFPYLNEAGRRSPEWFGLGDLDYGQDLDRFGEACRRRGIDSIWLAYQGTADPAVTGIREVRTLAPHQTVEGWVGISLSKLRLGNDDDLEAYAWLRTMEPVERIGSSMLLYRIPPQTVRDDWTRRPSNKR